jgi:hypothetical protein
LSIVTSFIQYGTENLSQSNKAREEIEVIQIGKEDIQLSMFPYDMTLKYPKNYSRRPYI